MAVQLGYKNVYRDPHGYPAWKDSQLPISMALSETAADGPSTTDKGYGNFRGLAIFWILLGIFFGGMALNLTPCVYPLIPITVSYFGGRSGRGG